MNYIKLILLVLLLFYSIPVSSQPLNNNQFNHAINFNIGITDFHIKDELSTPFIYRNNGIHTGIGYEFTQSDFKHLLSVNFNYVNLNSKYTEYYAQNYSLGIEYIYLRKVSEMNKLIFFAGGSWYSFINFTQYNIETKRTIAITNNIYYLTHSISAISMLEFNLSNSNSISITFGTAVISNVSRTQYSSYPGLASGNRFILFDRFSMFWENLFLNTTLNYSQQLTNNIGGFIYYNFQYGSYPVPRRIAFYSNNLNLGFKIHF